jgi:predicted DNA-binding transcriptional regulator AlpA
MTIDMNDTHLTSVTQLAELVKFGDSVKFNSHNQEETYDWISQALGKFHYFSESKKNRGIIKNYVMTLTGYSDSQIDKLIKRKKTYGRIFLKERTQHTFPKKYETSDVALLADVTSALNHPNGKAVKQMMYDMYHIYEDNRFEKLQQISVSHFYNLRETNIFQSRILNYTKTKPVKVNIGLRKKPSPFGKPGYLRVDSVHQGDLDKEKGVYHINLVDEVTQWEIVGCVEGISEEFLVPLLSELLKMFPFTILGFHSDNGSEYINKVVSFLLNKLSIEQTKSRSRKSNDNALVEGKNNAIIRKQMGYVHIPKRHAQSINRFYQNHLNNYLGFHRHCAFATEVISDQGKIKKKYDIYLTPCQKLLSIPNVEQYLKTGVSKGSLMEEQMKMSHVEAAQNLQKAKTELFKQM